MVSLALNLIFPGAGVIYGLIKMGVRAAEADSAAACGKLAVEMFSQIDRNGDGVLSPGEQQGFAQQASDMIKQGKVDSQGQKVLTFIITMFKLVAVSKSSGGNSSVIADAVLDVFLSELDLDDLDDVKEVFECGGKLAKAFGKSQGKQVVPTNITRNEFLKAVDQYVTKKQARVASSAVSLII